MPAWLRAVNPLQRGDQVDAVRDVVVDTERLEGGCDTAAQLGATGFTNAGNFVARPFAVAANGEYPLQRATFYAPGAPFGVNAGLRFTF